MSRAKARLIGTHAMVSLCPWVAHSITENRPCYKQDFYGIPSHRCLQMSPWAVGCNHCCVHCWRPPQKRIVEEIIKPDKLLQMVEHAHSCLVRGFKGNSLSDKVKKMECQKPNNVAMSLTGETWMYPHIDELIGQFKNRDYSVVVVTSGAGANKLISMKNMPSLLYLSLIAYDAPSYTTLCNPQNVTWHDLMGFCRNFRFAKTKRIVRLTVIRNLNDNLEACEKFAKLMEITSPDFIEIRSFIPVSRAKVLGRHCILHLKELFEFSSILCRFLSVYKIIKYNESSEVILLEKS